MMLIMNNQKIYDPNKYVGDNYDADKLHVSNKIYAKIQGMSDDIIGLENIAKENGIILIKKNNSENQPKDEQVHQDNESREDIQQEQIDIKALIFILCTILACLILFVVIGTCGGKHNSVEQFNNNKPVDSKEVVGSMATNDDTSVSELPTKTFSNGIYSIQYPKDWIVSKNNGEYTDVYIYSPNSDISLQIIHYSIDKSLDEIQENLDANLIKSGFDIVEKQKLTIGGENALGRVYFKIDKNGSIENPGITLMVYNMKRNDILYNIKFSNCFKQENEEIARSIVKTFFFS